MCWKRDTWLPLMAPGDSIFMLPAFFFLRQEQILQIFCTAMCGEGRSQAHDFDPKEWNPVFLEIRNFKGGEECEHVDEGEETEFGEDGEDGDGCDGCDGMLELRYTEDTMSAPAAKETAKFCGNVQLDHLEGRAHTAGNKRAAWVDDRSRAGEPREYSNRLAAIDLYRLLKDRVCGEPQKLVFV